MTVRGSRPRELCTSLELADKCKFKIVPPELIIFLTSCSELCYCTVPVFVCISVLALLFL